MDNIIDLTDDTNSHDVLHSTGSGGLIGGKLLNNRPLAEYLEDDETVEYVIRNKKSGLEIVSELGGTETVAPASDYQALAAVTDRRLLVVVGQSTGNETKSLSFTEVLDARAKSSGLRSTTLEVETLDGDTWKFPCKGDPASVGTYIEDVAQTWANADRLIDDVQQQIETATSHLGEDDHDAAIGVLDGAEETIATARQRIEAVGSGPRAAVQDRADRIAARLAETTRRVAASRGGAAHADAQDEWERGNYETAAQAYETAVTAYEVALDREGATPSDFTLAKRLRGAAGERELLRAGPLIDADTARRKADSLSDPEDAAHEWETALESFRDMLGIDWGDGERDFVADKRRIQKYAKETAGDAIADHREAGRKWLTAGDELSIDGREGQAEQVYRRAKDQFERAHRLASEVRPERAADLKEDIEIAKKRLQGEGIPDEKPDETVIPSDNEGDADDRSIETDAGADEAVAAVDQQTGVAETDDTDRTPSTGSSGTMSVSQDDGGSLIDKIRSDKQRQSGGASGATQAATETGEAETTSETEEEEATVEASDTEATVETGEKRDAAETTTAATEPTPAIRHVGPDDAETETDTTESKRSDTPAGESKTTTDADGGSDIDIASEEIAERLRTLDEDAFTDLVADIWEAQGWSTTVFSATAKAVYDIMAMRTEPEEHRLLLWTVHRQDGGALGATVIKRCATARDSSQGADSATLVTTGSLTNAAQRSADELGITVVDSEKLADIIRFESLGDRLVEATETGDRASEQH